MATRTISEAGGNSTETKAWAEGVVPTEADDVVATNRSGNLTLTSHLICRSINLENYTGTLNQNGEKIVIGTSSTNPSGIAAKFPTTGFTWTSPGIVDFASTSAGLVTIDLGGHETNGHLTFEGVGGNYKFLRGAIISSAHPIEVLKGTVDLNGQAFSVGAFICDATAARTLKFNGATIAVTGTGEVWNFTSTGLTLEPGTGTSITITDTSSTPKKLILGGLDYAPCAWIIKGGGIGAVEIPSTSNTMGTLVIQGPKTVKFAAGKTQTLTELEAEGATGNLIALESTESGVAFTLSVASGNVTCDYIRLKDSHATGGAVFYAGTHSEDISDNEGWRFESPPAGPVIAGEGSLNTLAETLSATVNPGGLETEYLFEWGTTIAYGEVTTVGILAGVHEPKAVSTIINGLTASTTYHWRVVAKNSIGESKSPDQTFTAAAGAVLSMFV